ncbi:MAG: helix-turn-helix domain-containing protein [Candidatus Dormibacteraeota bacterium]|nr:helix-turn-helix domain-containing protein [Candidatus Dormibacteraeota bacterium]
MTATHRLATGFGQRVRSLRVAAGLTQAELAERAGISERTISDLERGLRGTVYPATARKLAAALDVNGDQLADFLADAQGEDARRPPLISRIPSTQRARLPVPLTRLLGRASEVARVHGLVRDPGVRLVTLVGAGGIGKTRLAIEVASTAQVDFPGGTFFVSLSDADDPKMVLPLIATAVGMSPVPGDMQRALARRLSEDRALVVLDTLEHLVAAAPALANLLEASPNLTILATSRAPLRLRGEHEVQVPPLQIGAEPDDESAAVELFLERAAAVAPGFDPSPAAIELVADICARTDGLPLAIELAAAGVKYISLGELRMHLEHRLEPLVGGARDLPARQRTMRGTHDWSYALLGASEMRLFRCLAAFRGSFGREAAEAMTRPTGAADVMGALGVLVDSSLVQVERSATGEGRYRLLDITRAYAMERSVAAGEFDALRQRHADYFLALAVTAEPELRGRQQQQWHARLLEDEGNFRAGLTWALEVGHSEVALRLAGALWMFWRWAGLFAEGRAWLEAALTGGKDCALEVRCQGFWGAGWLAFHAGDYGRTRELGEEMLQLLAGRDNVLHRRNALTLVGSAALAEGRNDAAVAAYGEALAVCSGLGTSWHLATSQLNLGTAELQSGRKPEARALFEQALRIYDDLGDQHFTARVLVQLGYVGLLTGQVAEATARINRAMTIFAELGDGWAIAEGLEAIATLRSEGDETSAVQLASAAQRLRERIAMQPHPPDARINRAYLELARRRLTREAFEEAWIKGTGMTIEAAVDLALTRSGGKFA